MTELDIALIDPPAEPVRRHVSPEDQRQLEDSIRELGVTTPILVAPEGERFRVIAGARRLAAAGTVGLATIPVNIRAIEGADATAAALAENIVRAGMAEAEKWRAFHRMRVQGRSLPAAQQALGLTARRAQRWEALSGLPEPVIELAARWGAPEAAAATQLIQADRGKLEKIATTELRRATEGYGRWWQIAHAVEVRTCNQADALFDIATSGIGWDEDLFAQPDDERRFTTRETTRFLDLQRQAVGDAINALAAKGIDAAFAETNGHGQAKPPRGMTALYEEPKRLKKPIAVRFKINSESGRVTRLCYEPRVAAGSSDASRTQRAAGGEEADAASSTTAAEPAAAREAPDLSKKTRAAIAQKKTLALRAHLNDERPRFADNDMIAALLLAFAARNVSLHAKGHDAARRVIHSLLGPDGSITASTEEIRRTARVVLAHLLAFDGPDDAQRSQYSSATSGPAAEWIAFCLGVPAITWGAVEELEMLPAAMLRRLCADRGIRKSGSVHELAVRLAEVDLADFQPPGAAFGADAPPEAVHEADAAGDDDASDDEAGDDEDRGAAA